MRQIVMPRLGLLMSEGTVSKWFKAVGDAFVQDEPIFEVEIDKAVSEVPAAFSGKLLRILVDQGITVPVATPVAEAEEN